MRLFFHVTLTPNRPSASYNSNRMSILLYTHVYPVYPVDATIGNQAFSHDECNMLPGLSYNKAE